MSNALDRGNLLSSNAQPNLVTTKQCRDPLLFYPPRCSMLILQSSLCPRGASEGSTTRHHQAIRPFHFHLLIRLPSPGGSKPYQGRLFPTKGN